MASLKFPLVLEGVADAAAGLEAAMASEAVGMGSDGSSPQSESEESDEGVAEGVATVGVPSLPLVVSLDAVVPPTPGFWVRSTSCEPSAMGPEGFAGQEPAGLTGALIPKGMVPLPPTVMLPTKVVGLSPWNWHWKSPLSSALRGADWQ